MLTIYIFLLYAVARELYQTLGTMKIQSSRRGVMKSAEYTELQLELFSENALKNLKPAYSTDSAIHEDYNMEKKMEFI